MAAMQTSRGNYFGHYNGSLNDKVTSLIRPSDKQNSYLDEDGRKSTPELATSPPLVLGAYKSEYVISRNTYLPTAAINSVISGQSTSSVSKSVPSSKGTSTASRTALLSLTKNLAPVDLTELKLNSDHVLADFTDDQNNRFPKYVRPTPHLPGKGMFFF